MTEIVLVPLAQIEAEIGKRLSRLARNAKIPGFRPGKVPLKIVAQQYGPQVRSDVISDAVQASFADAVREQNLRVAGYPRIEPKADGTDAGELAFSAVFEIYPDVKLGDLADVVVERPVAEVAAADVEHTIEVLRKQRTRYEHVERPAAEGDRVLVDFTGTIDGVAFQGGQAKDFAIVIGEGAMLPEFDAAVWSPAGDRQQNIRALGSVCESTWIWLARLWHRTHQRGCAPLHRAGFGSGSSSR